MIVYIDEPERMLYDYLKDNVPKSHFYAEITGSCGRPLIHGVFISPCNYSRDPYKGTNIITITGRFGKTVLEFEDEFCKKVEVRKGGL